MKSKRTLIFKLPKKQSIFLWGPRQTGKTTYLKEHYPDSALFDFLDTKLFFEYTKRPYLLKEQILELPKAQLKKPIILDEVQKVPALLDEVHWLIENQGLSFILCGSSARKLKRSGANMLGGRAWYQELCCLTSQEIKNFQLLRALNHGLLPKIYYGNNPINDLEAYVHTYLKEEILEEGLARNVAAFSRFFEAVAFCHGQMINYANIASDCGIDAKTVKEYFQILIDTLLGTYIQPYRKKHKREVLTSKPKFYLFDVGLANYLQDIEIKNTKGPEFGAAFEHFILMEILAYKAYRKKRWDVSFWRTKTGLEVDFVIGKGQWAIEVKGSNRIDSADLKGLMAFKEEHSPKECICICKEQAKRSHQSIKIVPWQQFLKDLWAGKFF